MKNEDMLTTHPINAHAWGMYSRAMGLDAEFNEGDHPRDESGKFGSGGSSLPPRTASTMSNAISMSSPSGHVSKRSHKASVERLGKQLFGEHGLPKPQAKQPAEKERMLQQAKELRGLAERGMKPRAYMKRAEELERQASSIA